MTNRRVEYLRLAEVNASTPVTRVYYPGTWHEISKYILLVLEDLSEYGWRVCGMSDGEYLICRDADTSAAGFPLVTEGAAAVEMELERAAARLTALTGGTVTTSDEVKGNHWRVVLDMDIPTATITALKAEREDFRYDER